MACPICAYTPDNPEYLFLYETGHWIATLAPNQCLVGRTVVQLKRHLGDLAGLNDEEMLDFLALIRRHEGAMRRAFGATLFNWNCYMNLAYLEAQPDPHVHWWAVPRYDHPFDLGGLSFTDPDFGHPYPHSRWQDIPGELRAEIVKKIQAGL